MKAFATRCAERLVREQPARPQGHQQVAGSLGDLCRQLRVGHGSSMSTIRSAACSGVIRVVSMRISGAAGGS